MTGNCHPSPRNQNMSPRHGARVWLGVPTLRGALASLQPCMHLSPVQRHMDVVRSALGHDQNHGDRSLQGRAWEEAVGNQWPSSCDDLRGRRPVLAILSELQEGMAGLSPWARGWASCTRPRLAPVPRMAQCGSGLEVAVTHTSQRASESGLASLCPSSLGGHLSLE